MINDDFIYVCMRKKDMPAPYVPCHTGKCGLCGEEVYYSKYVYANEPRVRKAVAEDRLVCVDCANEMLQKEADRASP